MHVLSLLGDIVKQCARVISFGAKIQEPARKDLVDSLQQICDKCEDAYSVVLKRLLPVKAAFNDPKNLAAEMRLFAADDQTRKAFKPEHLCGEIAQLLSRLESNLDPLKYSIDVMRIRSVRDSLKLIGDYDGAIREQYHEFAVALDRLSLDLDAADLAERKDLKKYVQNVIQDFEDELNETIANIRKAKAMIV